MGAVVGGVAVLAGLAGAVLHAINSAAGRTHEPSFWMMGLSAAVGYGLVAVVLRRADARGLRGLVAGIGLLQGGGLLSSEWALLDRGSTIEPWTTWLGTWLWAPAYIATACVVPLLLPNGRLTSSRWRPALWVGAAAVVTTALSWALTPYDLQDFPAAIPGVTNPVALEAGLPQPVPTLSTLVLFAAVVLSVASLVVRWRRSSGVERQQLKWVMLGVASTLVLLGAGVALPLGVALEEGIAAAAMLPLPVVIVVAVLKHGLWDVDVVISRSLMYAVLATGVVALYLATVWLVGDLVGASTAAPAVATGLVAFLVLASHSSLQRWVNRLVHGNEEEPYAVLARLGDRLAAASDAEDLADRVLPSVVAQVARALRARGVTVALLDGTEVSEGVPDRSVTDADVVRLPLEHAGSPVGSLSVRRTGGLGWAEQRVLDRLARQAAVAAHTVLTAREAQHARESVVLAREEERRRLRRDLHDDVGPSLAALALHAETARDLAAEDPAAAAELLDRLVPRLNATVAGVRALVHELRPPTLDELGLAAAVRELSARLSTAATTVTAATQLDGELPAAVEVAAYRIAGEACANAVRHARATRVQVVLRAEDGMLRLTVSDDGAGLPDQVQDGLGLPSMRQRAEELGGSLEVRSDGSGTRLTALIPLLPAAAPPVSTSAAPLPPAPNPSRPDPSRLDPADVVGSAAVSPAPHEASA